MAEEHRCQAPEGHHLCANNCGFLGSPATMNLCSKCYRDYCLQQRQQQQPQQPSPIKISAPSSSSSPSPVAESLPPPTQLTLAETRTPAATEVPASAVAGKPNRCFVCRKRVGLTGFKCRCETTFCGVHRYPEKHGCSFDYKKVGREEIARANPLVVAEKLEKI